MPLKEKYSNTTPLFFLVLTLKEHCIDVYNFLKSLELTQHIETFRSNGFEEMEIFMGTFPSHF